MRALANELGRKSFRKDARLHVLSTLGVLSIVAGVVELFFPGAFVDRTWIAWPVLAAALTTGVVRAWPRPIRTDFGSPSTTVRVVPGDMFEASSDHLVIGVSTSFETEPPAVASTSIQGQFLARVYGNDALRLNADIASALAGRASGQIDTFSGSRPKFALGTTAVLRGTDRQHFLLAYTEMGPDSHVTATVDGLWHSLTILWDSVRRNGNGATVRIGVLGGGLSNLSSQLPAVDAIRFQILSFILASRVSRVSEGLTIVVRPSEFEKLDHTALQIFLDSLK
jgi:hypothetical protein